MLNRANRTLATRRGSRRRCHFESLENRELLTFIAQISGTDNVYMPDATHVADSVGNTYVGGRFQGTADFDPGPDTFELSSEWDSAFVAKYGPEGELLWARGFDIEGRSKGLNSPLAMTGGLAVDGNGAVYATGRFNYSIDLTGNGDYIAAPGKECAPLGLKF